MTLSFVVCGASVAGARRALTLIVTVNDVAARRIDDGGTYWVAGIGSSGSSRSARPATRNSDALVPRNGYKLIVGIVARISGCANQTELSLADQLEHAKQIIAEMYDGPVEFRPIATIGKGEALDRPELEQIEAELRKGEMDVLVMEDLGRLVRGADAIRLLGVAVDHDIRVIVANDSIDTIDEAWERAALRASGEHVGRNVHTSRRLNLSCDHPSRPAPHHFPRLF